MDKENKEVTVQIWFPLDPEKFSLWDKVKHIFSRKAMLWTSGNPLVEDIECSSLLTYTCKSNGLPAIFAAHLPLAFTNSVYTSDLSNMLITSEPMPVAFHSHVPDALRKRGIQDGVGILKLSAQRWGAGKYQAPFRADVIERSRRLKAGYDMIIKDTDHQNFCEAYLLANHVVMYRPNTLGGLEPLGGGRAIARITAAFFERNRGVHVEGLAESQQPDKIQEEREVESALLKQEDDEKKENGQNSIAKSPKNLTAENLLAYCTHAPGSSQSLALSYHMVRLLEQLLLLTACLLVFSHGTHAATYDDQEIIFIQRLTLENPIYFELAGISGDYTSGQLAATSDGLVVGGSNGAFLLNLNSTNGQPPFLVSDDPDMFFISDLRSNNIVAFGNSEGTYLDGPGYLHNLFLFDATIPSNVSIVALNQSIFVGLNSAVFAGYGHFILMDGARKAFYSVDTETGEVVSITGGIDRWQQTYGWIATGVAEFFTFENVHLLYANQEGKVEQQNIGDGSNKVEKVYTDIAFESLSSIAISP
eukprot:gene30264-36571_t